MASYGTRGNLASQSAKDRRDSSRGENSTAKCPTCDKLCKDNDKILVCRGCERFFHATCQKVPDDKYRVLAADSASDNSCMLWFCNSSCNIFAKKIVCGMVELKKEVELIKSKVDQVSTDICKVDSRLADFENGYMSAEQTDSVRQVVREEIDEHTSAIRQSFKEDIETEVSEQVTKSGKLKEIGEKVSDFVSEGIQEIREREFRRKNVIIHNVPMAKSKELKKRIEHDYRRFEYLCKEGLELEDKPKVKKITRLGKKEDKSRPMRVFLESSENVSEIFRATKNLKDKEKFKNVNIVSDRTFLEREEFKKLHQQKEMRQEESDRLGDGVTWTVKKGKVMKETEVMKVNQATATRTEDAGMESDPDEFWG